MKKLFTTFFTCLLTAGITLMGYTYYIEKRLEKTEENERISHHPYSSSEVQLGSPVDFTTAAEHTVNAVVHVKNLSYVTTRSNPLLEFFYGYKGGTQAQIGTGSGVIISEDGYIVTNNHVIANAAELEVTLNNNKTYKAQLIGTERQMDLALLKIETKEKLPFLTFGNSDDIKLGQWVLAVGNPYNLTSTVTAGIISAKARSLSETGIQSFIQTDAAVNPGNSGGALVNVQGELIGINTMISSNTGSYVGYAFAVPSNVTKKIVEDFLEYGDVQHGVLGVTGFELNNATAKALNLTRTKGFYVQEVSTQDEENNLKPGDVITTINGKEISSFVDIKNMLNTKRPGDKVQITLQRGQEVLQQEIKLSNGNTKSYTFHGLKLEDLTPAEKAKRNLQYGVKITQVTNKKYLPYQNDLIDAILVTLNGQPIVSVKQIQNTEEQDNRIGTRQLEIITAKGELMKLYL